MSDRPHKQVSIHGQIDLAHLQGKPPEEGKRKTSAPINLAGEDAETTEDSYSNALCEIIEGKLLVSCCLSIEDMIGKLLFSHMPEQYTLKKKLIVSRSITNGWVVYDVINILLIIYYSISYIIPLYHPGYNVTFMVNIINICVTQIFMFDFLLNCYMGSGLGYWANYAIFPIFELLSMFPGYFMLLYPGTPSVVTQYLTSFRIVSIFRITKHFKYMRNASGIRRQIVYLVLTMMVMIYLATTTVQLLENQSYDCIYINDSTNNEPSCSEAAPYDASDSKCDCVQNNCNAVYAFMDKRGEPSVILIPMRLSELQALLQLTNQYAKPYIPHNNESHVIITGYCTDKRKLESFLKEFFHPDRTEQEGEECHAVILCRSYPSEAIRALLLTHALESKVTWVLGSPLSLNDLKKVRAESANGIFFLINTDLHEDYVRVEDAATVLSALSASNFNSDLVSFVQVLRPENGDILLDSDVDMILCLDEYKTAIQARNALCPGFTTFVENIFHSFGNLDPEIAGKQMPPWFTEYLHGAGMEVYFVPLTVTFIAYMRYNFRRIAEIVYREWECVTLGVASESKDRVVFNPIAKDLHEYSNIKDFFLQFPVLVVMADDESYADLISSTLKNHSKVNQIIVKLMAEEEKFPCGNRQRLPRRDKYADLTNNNKMKTVIDRAGNYFFGNRFSFRDVDNTAEKHSMLGMGQQKHREGFVTKAIRRVSAGLAFIGSSASTSVAADEDGDSLEDDKLSDISEDSFTEDDMDDSDDELDTVNFIGYTKKRKEAMTGRAPMADLGSPSAPSTGSRKGGGKQGSPNSSTHNLGHNDSSDDDGDYSDDNVEPSSTFAMANILHTSQNRFGRPSSIIKGADFLSDHIIVSGCDTNFQMFVDEIRRPSANGEAYHPVLIVHDCIPMSWAYIQESYNDVYYYAGNITNMNNMNKLNINKAYSVALMSARTAISTVDEVHVNTETLFTFLKLEQHIPPGVHVTVELTSPSNMAVLNATIMRRIREHLESKTKVVGQQVKAQMDKEALTIDNGAHPGSSNQNRDKSVIFNENASSPPSSSRSRQNSPKRKQRDSQDLSQANISNLTPAELKSINMGVDKRRIAIFDGNGRFATKRTSTSHSLLPGSGDIKKLAMISGKGTLPGTIREGNESKGRYDDEQGGAADRLAGKGRKRRSSTFGLVASVINNLVDDGANANNFYNDNMEDVWDAMDSHHVLPVFASAKAFVPSSFESLLVQSFYLRLTPVICEKFVVGQLGQTMSSFQIPRQLVGKSFLDIFRLFIVHNVICLGLYRTPTQFNGAMLPYVYANPTKDTLLNKNDCVFVFGSPANIARVQISIRALGR